MKEKTPKEMREENIKNFFEAIKDESPYIKSVQIDAVIKRMKNKGNVAVTTTTPSCQHTTVSTLLPLYLHFNIRIDGY